jgi:hypothetical protein
VARGRRAYMKELAFRRALRSIINARLGPPRFDSEICPMQARWAHCCCGGLRRRGSLPSEIRYPARSLLHVRTPAAWRQRSHHPVHKARRAGTSPGCLGKRRASATVCGESEQALRSKLAVFLFQARATRLIVRKRCVCGHATDIPAGVSASALSPFARKRGMSPFHRELQVRDQQLKGFLARLGIGGAQDCRRMQRGEDARRDLM